MSDKAAQQAEFEAKKAELQLAPARVRRVWGVGALFGILMLLSYCASALGGYMGWGRALLLGVVQMVFCMGCAFAVWDGKSGAWWTFVPFIGFQSWEAIRSAARMVLSASYWDVTGFRYEYVFDFVSTVRLGVGILLLGLLFSTEVRHHVFGRKGSVSVPPNHDKTAVS